MRAHKILIPLALGSIFALTACAEPEEFVHSLHVSVMKNSEVEDSDGQDISSEVTVKNRAYCVDGNDVGIAVEDPDDVVQAWASDGTPIAFTSKSAVGELRGHFHQLPVCDSVLIREDPRDE